MERIQFGGHSTFIDLFGLYGFFTIMIFLFYFSVYRFIYKTIKSNENRIILNNIWLYYLTLSIINTVLATNLIVMLFVIIPFILKTTENNSKEL